MLKVEPVKSVTIQDVARKARVSTATVSRALSAPDSVSEKKRKAVEKAIQATGYRANRAARNLRTQRSHAVLALLPTLGNPFFSQVLHGIADALTLAGQTLIVTETAQLLGAKEDLLTYFEDRRADGIIVLDGSLPRSCLDPVLTSPHRSKVVFACEWEPGGGFSSVRSTNALGARQAVEHLIALGHSRIAHVTGPADNVLTETRHEGYLQACEAAQITPVVLPGDFSLQAGVDAAAALLALEERPTAVFCASDEIAYGLISQLTKEGFSVPHDVSVIGFDDIEYSAHFVPPLTTIRQDRVALGQAAARALIDAQNAGEITAEEIPVTMVARASTAALRT